jgi:uncharacterized repeat protein (TIGR01451 family)
MLLGVAVSAQNPSFSTTVNPGPAPLNLDIVFPGEQTSIRISLINSSTTSAITGVNFDKPLPDIGTHSLLMSGAASIGGDPGCVDGVLSTSVGQGQVELSGLTIPPDSVCFVDLPIVATSTNGASTSLSYSLNAGEVNSDQGSNSTGGPQTITVRPTQRPTWSKSLQPNDILVINGDTRTLRIEIANTDTNVALNDIAFTDLFPTSGAAGAIAEPTGTLLSNSCGGTVSQVAGSAASVSLTGGSVAPGSSCAIEVEVRGRQTDGVYNLSVNNVLPAVGFTNSTGLQPAADATQRMRARSPLAVTKNFLPDVVASGEQNTLRVRLTNNGSQALPVSSFTDDPIAAAPFADRLIIIPTGGITNSCGGSVSRDSGGQGFTVGGFSIPGGSFCDVLVTYVGTTPASDQPSTYTNQIAQGAVDVDEAGLAQPVPGAAIVSQARSATVLVADRLRVLKSADPDDASPGDPVRYNVTVQNFSAGAISDIDVTDNLQNGATLLLAGAFAPTLSPAVDCGTLVLNGAVQGDSSVTFTIPTLPGRVSTNTPGTCVISFSVMLDPAGSGPTDNQIDAGDVCFGNAPRICNGVGAGSSTDELATLSFAKTIDNQENVSKTEGAPARLQLRVENNSVNPLTNLTLSDTLPSESALQQLRVASPSNIANTCGGTVTAMAGSTSVALNGGTVPPYDGTNAGSCSLSVDVVGPAGEYPNVANVSAVRTNANATTTTLIESDDAMLTYTGALDTQKSFHPAQASPGGRATATIRFTSLDVSRPITGIELTDNLPPDMLVATPSNAFTTCNGSPVIDVVPGASAVSLSGALLAPATTCELIFDVEVTGNADWTNTIPAGGVTADGGLTNLSPVSATLLYTPPDAPLISKSITPGSIVPGQSAALVVTLTNGLQDLSNVSVTDFFTVDGLEGSAANGMKIAAAPLASTDCRGGIVVVAPDSRSVGLEGAALAPQEECQFSVQVTSTTVGTITNTIPLNSIRSSEGATNSGTFAQSTLNTSSDTGVGKTFTPAVVSPNEEAVLRLTVFNARAEALTGLTLVDEFPAGLELAAEPAPFSNCGGSVAISFPSVSSVRLDNGSVGPANGGEASSCYVEVRVFSAAEGTYVNTIAADMLLSNGTPVPHPAVDATLQVRERLEVHKAFDGLTLDINDPAGFNTGIASRLPGATAPLTIRLRNPNDIALTQVNFTDQLPDGLVLALPPMLATDCTDGVVSGVANGRDLRLSGATLSAAGSADDECTVSAEVVSNIPGVYTNEIPEGGVSSLEGVDNLPGTQAQIVITEPPVLTKEFNPPVVAPDVPTTLSIVLGNGNDVATSLNVDLVDNLPADPAQMMVAALPAITSNCPGGVADVSAAAAGTSVTIEQGTVIPPGGCVVTVDVTAPVNGDYLNTLPVGALVTDFGVNESPAQAGVYVSSLGYISGRVFVDNQAIPTGIYLPGSSTPVVGNVIELRRGTDCSGALVASTMTDSMGNYLFVDLLADTYSLCQLTQPADTLNSITTAGTIAPVAGSTGTPGVAENPVSAAPTSQITSIVLNNNGNSDEVSGSPDNNFSEVAPASIGGTVFFDANSNGVFDADESGIGGVSVSLSGPLVATAVTDAQGNYLFENLPPGDYTVSEVQPAAFTDGDDVLGTVEGAPRGDDSGNDVFAAITLAPGDVGVNYDFGEVLDSAALAITASASCSDNAPMIDYVIPALAGAGGSPPVTIRLLSVGNRLLEVQSDQPPAGSLLWPGVQVDETGMGIGWPGWEFVDGQWRNVPDDRVPSVVVEVSAGASAQTLVTFPANANGCRVQPLGTTTPQPPPTAAPIPVLPAFMLLLMTLLIGGSGIRRLRQQARM